ncbi:hypothetical protein AAFF_G00360530 [Aldrovandia affinis]|uniref:Uncharacterized protein n=1 Tax=Aldrovandia affinis TaxID=143900 RepID=A0AAD7WN77_9TELE|nr:hypothetical protein AAFF_G00360530 [Aldrovandia affinis]
MHSFKRQNTSVTWLELGTLATTTEMGSSGPLSNGQPVSSPGMMTPKQFASALVAINGLYEPAQGGTRSISRTQKRGAFVMFTRNPEPRRISCGVSAGRPGLGQMSATSSHRAAVHPSIVVRI